MEIIPYNNKLKTRARELRKNMILSEVILWKHISRRQILNYQFLRQKPISHYIVDFYCKELKLAIEVDGPIHKLKMQDDVFRQKQLESYGITFLRFYENDVRNNLEYVLRDIRTNILRLADSPPPSKEELS